MTAPVFEAPGPGSWLLDDVHFSRPASRYLVSVFPLAMPVGFRAGTKHYGLLLDYIAIAFVGNFFYSQPRLVGAPPGAKGPPPKLIFQILTRLHPEMRRRVKRSAEVFEKKDLARGSGMVERRTQTAIASARTGTAGGRS